MRGGAIQKYDGSREEVVLNRLVRVAKNFASFFSMEDDGREYARGAWGR